MMECDPRVNVVVIQESIAQPDITKEELTQRWSALERLPGVQNVQILAPKSYPSAGELDQLTAGADALFGVWIEPGLINADFLAGHPKLRYVATLGHGWESFDVELSRRHGLTITNTIYGAQTIAEYAFALLLEVCHHVAAHDRRIRTIDWSQVSNQGEFCQAVTPQIELFEKTIGIVGLGEIGYAVAKMAYGFGMRVVAYSAHKKSGEKYRFVEQVNNLDELLSRSDFISLHLPHTPATEHIIDARAITSMKDGVILINTARGALIDEQSLADALASGKIRAAGLDVLTEEPPLHGSPLLTAPNVIITGHIAWLTKESRLRAVDMAIQNFAAYLEGKPCSKIN
jgi:glycerate dehydrogenase